MWVVFSPFVLFSLLLNSLNTRNLKPTNPFTSRDSHGSFIKSPEPYFSIQRFYLIDKIWKFSRRCCGFVCFFLKEVRYENYTLKLMEHVYQLNELNFADDPATLSHQHHQMQDKTNELHRTTRKDSRYTQRK